MYQQLVAMGPLTTASPTCFDPAVEPLRRANPHRYRDVRPGHLAVVAGCGRPWFIGRVCDVSTRPWSRTPGFVQVINVDSGDVERIPAPWIVELMSDCGLGRRPLPA
jgi:hypothetical protein